MDDSGSSSVLVSQVDSVSLVQLSKHRGSRASVLLPPQPIALHQGAFTSRPGRSSVPQADDSTFQFQHRRKLTQISERKSDQRAVLNLDQVNNCAVIDGTYETNSCSSKTHSIILFPYEHLQIIR